MHGQSTSIYGPSHASPARRPVFCTTTVSEIGGGRKRPPLRRVGCEGAASSTISPKTEYEMKVSQAVCVWLVAAILGASSAHAEPAVGRIVRESVERLAQAWNTSDANRWAAEYWPDGELINVLGTVLAGADQVRDRTAEILVGPFRGSHFAFIVRSIRFVGTDAVIVDTD